ncbi:hypothetical protein HDU88_005712 [Geranomyces variabilis]|nr:hypothetical protein HDU88_005712 [Geranomyces variabilis]
MLATAAPYDNTNVHPHKEGSIADRLRAQKDSVTKFVFDAASKLLLARPLPNQTRDSLNTLFGSSLEGRDHTVCVRVRPLLKHKEEDAGSYSVVTTANPTLLVHSVDFRWNGHSNIRTNTYDADMVFGPEDSTEAVYNVIARPLIPLALSNGLGTLLAYGQTGSGKTFTTTGIQERVAQDIFTLAEQHRQTREPTWDGTVFKFRNGPRNGFLRKAWFSRRYRTLSSYERGASLRRTEATVKNATSSRSHAVCCLRVKNTLLPEAEDGMLYLVDLAGSESNSDSSNHSRERIAETKEINKSLGTLKECFRNRALIDSADSQHVHIPFRSLRLTLLLKEAFDPASTRLACTTVIANLAPGITDAPQTLSTMRYISPLRLPVRSTALTITDPSNPAGWSNSQLREWVRANYPGGKVDPAVLCPTESGKQMCRLPIGTFIARCLLSGEDVTEKGAKLLFEKMWELLITARLRARRKQPVAGAKKSLHGEAGASSAAAVKSKSKKNDNTFAAANAVTIPDLKPGTFIALNPDGVWDKHKRVPAVALLLEPHAGGAWTVADLVDVEGDQGGYELLIAIKWVAPQTIIKGPVEMEYLRTSRTYRITGYWVECFGNGWMVTIGFLLEIIGAGILLAHLSLPVYFIGEILIGLGWKFGYIASSSRVTTQCTSQRALSVIQEVNETLTTVVAAFFATASGAVFTLKPEH